MKSAFSVHNIFGDHMVLQRGKPIRIAGTAFPGVKVRGSFAGDAATGKAGPDGEWVIEFPAREAGGPYELTVSITEGASITFRDILVGEVWFASGQSNMEFHVVCPPFYGLRDGEAVAAAANDDSLRLCNVPRCIAPDAPCSENPVGTRWLPATTRGAVAPFSAVAYYFGVKLREKLGVPVGLINGSWGGTRIEPWIPRAGYIDAGRGEMLNALDESLQNQFVPPDPNKPPFDPYGGAYRDWIVNKFEKYAPEATADAVANWMKPGNDPAEWQRCPGNMNAQLLEVGTVWLRCQADFPAEYVGHDAVLHYGYCDDCDEAFVDGEKVGETTAFVDNFWAIPRDYKFKLGQGDGTGRHLIVIRAKNHFNVGSIGADICLSIPGGPKVELGNAEWEYRVEFRVDAEKIGVRPSPDVKPGSALFSCDAPSTLYNAMVHPSTFMNMRGAIWYQGCSNSSAPDFYAILQKIQIESWRKAWRDDSMPFLITQLSAFAQHRPENRLPDDFWKNDTPESNYGYAHFRFMQERFLDYPGAGVACTIDVGDHSDIHPPDKKSVGFRLAHEAMRVAYGDASSLPGPRFGSARRVTGGVEISISNIGDGLVLDGGAIGPHLFAVQGENGAPVWTDAELRPDGTLFVKDAGVGPVTKVQYAYSAFPPNPSIRRKGDGLPLFPFTAEVAE